MMTGSLSSEKLDLISRLRGEIQEMLAGQLKLKMYVSDYLEEHPGENVLAVLFTSGSGSGAESRESPPDHVPGRDLRTDRQPARRKPPVLVGKPRHFQQFLNKEGPDYDREFMLDLEFNYGSATCTIYHINLPGFLRGKGLGTIIVNGAELLARQMGMEKIYVPAEHRATPFWLKNGYRFGFPGEEAFFRKNSSRSNLYVAYDLRKELAV